MRGGLESHYSNTQGYLTYLPWTKHSSRLTVSGPLIPPPFALRILTPQQASLHSLGLGSWRQVLFFLFTFKQTQIALDTQQRFKNHTPGRNKGVRAERTHTFNNT